MTQFDKPTQNKALPFLLIICVALGIYYNALRAPFLGDDYPAIVHVTHLYQNGDFASFQQAARDPTRYIPFLTFALNYRFNGLDVFGYHMFNLMVHMLSAMLTYWLSGLLLRTPGMNQKFKPETQQIFSTLTALIFLTHPIQTQAVSYIHQRLTSIAAMFYLLSLSCYVMGRLRTITNRSGRLWFVGSLVIAFLGIFTKENIFSLPLAVLCVEFCFFLPEQTRNLKLFIQHLKNSKVIPTFLLLTVIMALIPLSFVLRKNHSFNDPISQSHTGDVITTGNYLLTQSRVLVKYVQLLFVPYNQSFDYDFPVSTTLLDPATLVSFAILIVIFGLGLFCLKRNPLIAFGIFWFFITLSVESTFFRLNNVIWEYRLYLPMFGFAMLLTALIFSAAADHRKILAYGVCVVVLFSILTVRRNQLYADPVELWKDNTTKNPNKSRSHTQLAGAYIQAQEFDLAQKHAHRAIELEPDSYKAYFYFAAAYSLKGQYESALAYAQKAFELQPLDDLNARQVGYIYFRLRQYDHAFAHYEKAISLSPTPKNINEYFQLVLTFYRTTQDKPKALDHADRLKKYHLDNVTETLRKLLDEPSVLPVH